MALTDVGYCELNCRMKHPAAVAILTSNEMDFPPDGDVSYKINMLNI